MFDVLARNWRWIALRGLVAVIFGLLALFYPALTVAMLVLIFGVFVILDGVLTIISAVVHRRQRRFWIAPIIAGILAIAIGVAAFVLPAITALVLLYLIAAWAVITGIAEIIAGIRLRKVIEGEWMLILTGVLAVIFGVLLFLFPGAGALAMVLWIGIFAFVIGVLLIAVAFRLRRWHRQEGAAGAR